MFEPLQKLNNAIMNISIHDIFKSLFDDKDFTDIIIRLNTEGEATSQLAEGINNQDVLLSSIGGGYSPHTLAIHPEKSRNIVTLLDTGEFYASFKAYWTDSGNGEIEIKADTIKDGTDLMERWGKDIIGLDDENIGILRDFARGKLRTIILNQIKQAA